jgi:hypothetical protein
MAERLRFCLVGAKPGTGILWANTGELRAFDAADLSHDNAPVVANGKGLSCDLLKPDRGLWSATGGQFPPNGERRF